MSVILAAGGKSSRFSRDGQPKQLACDPVYGKPLIDHLIERLAAETDLDRIIVVGSEENNTAELVRQHLQGHRLLKKLRSSIELDLGPKKGMGEALFRGIRRELSFPEQDIIMGVSDTVPITFRNLFQAKQAVVLGVTPVFKSDKKYSLIHVDSQGLTDFDSGSADTEVMVQSGLYKVEGCIREFLYETLLKGIEDSASMEVWDSKGEMRLTWAWRKLQTEGVEVGAASLGGMLEVNTTLDLCKSRFFFER